MELSFHYSPFFDFAISQEPTFKDEADTHLSQMSKYTNEISHLWNEIAKPLVQSMKNSIGLENEIIKEKVYLSQSIKLTVFDPWVIKIDQEQIQSKGITSWKKNTLLTLLNGPTHLIGHQRQISLPAKLQERYSHFNPLELNYLLYYSMLYPIYMHYFPEAIRSHLFSGGMKSVWKAIESEGYKNLLQEIFQNPIKVIEVDENVKDKVYELFS